MNSTFPSAPVSPGLIVAVPGHGGLWDREGLELVGNLEERLSCFVTFVAAAGSSPTLEDGMAACRFMGCCEAVLVDVSGGVSPAGSQDRGRTGFRLLRVSVEPSTHLIEAAYHSAFIVEDAVGV